MANHDSSVVTTRVKICGITRRADAEAAAEAGADAVGFVFWKGSPRRVEAEAARELGRDLPGSPIRVGVFVDEEAPVVEAVVRGAGLDVAQLHGDESPEYCRSLRIEWYRAFRIGPDTETAEVAGRVEACGARCFMLDSLASARGGTGVTFDWKAATKISMRTAGIGGRQRSRLILAGGLTPDNVALAIRLVRPWAVDVSSGVESSPGVKDPFRVRAFVQAARSAG